jgi:hypothetical protein
LGGGGQKYHTLLKKKGRRKSTTAEPCFPDPDDLSLILNLSFSFCQITLIFRHTKMSKFVKNVSGSKPYWYLGWYKCIFAKVRVKY